MSRAGPADRATLAAEMARVRRPEFEPFTLFRAPAMRGQYVNVTEVGFRAGAPGQVWPLPPEAESVFLFGGSTAFGYELSDEETIAARLAAHLRATHPAAAVYNFASPNHHSVQERIRFEQLVLHGHVPRCALFLDGFGEFLWPYYAPAMLGPFADAVPRPGLRRAVSGAARTVWERVRPAARRGRAFDRGLPDAEGLRALDPGGALDRYVRNMRLVQAACAAFGARALFAWQPVPCYAYPGAHRLPQPGALALRERLLGAVREGYALMAERQSALGPSFVWLGDMQAARTDLLYADADHYTAAFADEIASVLAGVLRERGLLALAA